MVIFIEINNQINENVKNENREFHLWDLPDNLFILIKNDINDLFFIKMYKVFGTQKEFSNYLGIARQTINKFHKQVAKDKGAYHSVYLSIKFFKKCKIFLDNDLLNTIEQNISEIKSGNGLSIYNPKLPIKESIELYRIIAHMIGDGSASAGKTPYYANTCKELREQFKRDLQIFGNMKIYENTPNTTEVVNFPKVVTDILSYTFNVQFTYPNRLPKLIFTSNSEFNRAFLRALFDDEGSISVCLTVTIHNINIMEEIKRLINLLGIKTSKIMIHPVKNKTDKVYFSIPVSYYKKFQNEIGFTHPEKIKKLEFAIKTRERKQRTRDPIYIEQEILRILDYKPSATLDLANELVFTLHGVLHHLNRMLDDGLIIKRGYKNKVIWDIA